MNKSMMKSDENLDQFWIYPLTSYVTNPHKELCDPNPRPYRIELGILSQSFFFW